MSAGYIEAAVINGGAAWFLARLADNHAARTLRYLPVELRAEVDSAIEALRRAGRHYDTAPVQRSMTAGGPMDGPPDSANVTLKDRDRSLSISEAATIAGVTERHMRRLARPERHGGKGLGRKVGRAWVINSDDLDIYLQVRRTHGA
ncbi:hypothetical protein GCM10009557_11530 [Virgisporangium ochraceum]|uniref:Helix-turn-helix domain-containing protein n=1 Tax=Virgisporangium ochraceum TaxID=65505 RepID=A0A8J4ECV0_9ACTN|nr:hypothetical protein Voc01_048150 [Virgisporangium ochraceum]